MENELKMLGLHKLCVLVLVLMRAFSMRALSQSLRAKMCRYCHDVSLFWISVELAGIVASI